MLKIGYTIKIGSVVCNAGQQTQLIELRSHSELTIPVNTCCLVLGLPQGLTISPEELVSVELGDENKQTLVFTGKVSRVDWSIDRVRIEAASTFGSLTAARLNRVYEKPNAGDIVKDILKWGKVKVGQVQNGLKFSVYGVGDLMSAYDHLETLAQQCGFDFYANTQDKAVFAKYKPASSHQFKYGEDILALELEQPHPGVEKVEIYGESPSSQGQGEQAYSWLTKKEVKGTAGSGSGITTLRLTDPTARTQAVAQKMAEAVLAKQRQKQRGEIKVLGNANVKLGDEIKVSKMPMATLNGSFKVTGVSHRLNRRSGFCTVIDWEEV
ncbi:hypothetical protein [Moorena sp. SIO3B2]|uniref:hypothetical protein n=1 Tax=Moorena sp. SIO3B2 TaxID=2607827 RepID=UPI0013C9CF52|nr:hypothetical protein [Moorena sp. SIO3B2]NEP36243.1 hypothetical protein [Moorena sp. SIO3B2]